MKRTIEIDFERLRKIQDDLHQEEGAISPKISDFIRSQMGHILQNILDGSFTELHALSILNDRNIQTALEESSFRLQQKLGNPLISRDEIHDEITFLVEHINAFLIAYNTLKEVVNILPLGEADGALEEGKELALRYIRTKSAMGFALLGICGKTDETKH